MTGESSSAVEGQHTGNIPMIGCLPKLFGAQRWNILIPGSYFLLLRGHKLSRRCFRHLIFLSLHGGCSILAPRRILMPGALASERHDNTLDGKDWSPMLSRLLGVFVLQYPVTQVLALHHYQILPLQHHVEDYDDDYFIPFVGSCSQFFGPRFATFSNLCLINFYGHLMWGTHHHQQQIEEERDRKGHPGWTLNTTYRDMISWLEPVGLERYTLALASFVCRGHKD